MDSGAKDGGVGGEALEEAQLGVELEEGDLGAGLHGVEVGEQLVADVGLCGEGRVEGIEEEDGGGGPGQAGREGISGVGEGIGGERRRAGPAGELGRGEGMVLFEAGDGLGLAVFKKLKVLGGQAVDGVAFGVGDDDVEQDGAGVGLEGEDAGVARLERGRCRLLCAGAS